MDSYFVFVGFVRIILYRFIFFSARAVERADKPLQKGKILPQRRFWVCHETASDSEDPVLELWEM